MNAIEPCPQCMSTPGDAAHLLEHARTCGVCQAHVRQVKPACNDPALGFLASLSLGEPEPLAELDLHLDGCVACHLERLGFESLDERAVNPRSAWVARLQLSAHSR